MLLKLILVKGAASSKSLNAEIETGLFAVFFSLATLAVRLSSPIVNTPKPLVKNNNNLSVCECREREREMNKRAHT